jgi:hypothetical protein
MSGCDRGRTRSGARASDAHHRYDGRLVGALRQVRHLLLERVREGRVRCGPRNQLRANAAASAIDTTQVIAKLRVHAAEVDMAPQLRVPGSLTQSTTGSQPPLSCLHSSTSTQFPFESRA